MADDSVVGRNGPRAGIVRPWLIVAAVLFCAGCEGSTPSAPRARGDAGVLVRSVPEAVAVVQVRIERVARIDRHGYKATARVERQLSGPHPPGTNLEIAWEELATQRAPRFARGEVVVVALVPLPATTIYLHRFPPQVRNDRTLAVAAAGEAFVRDLAPQDLNALAEAARLLAIEKQSAATAVALARLLVANEASLAFATLDLLDQDWISSHRADPALLGQCELALRNPNVALRLRHRLLDWAVRRELTGLVPVLSSIAAAEDPLAPAAIHALKRLGHPVPSEQLVRWLEVRDPTVRASAVLALHGDEALPRLRGLASDDPAPEVRVAALVRLREIAGNSAFDSLTLALADPVPEVRLAAAGELSRLGERVQTELEEFALAARGDAALAAVAAFEQMGTPGRPSLMRLASAHPEPAVRNLAQIALRKPHSEHGDQPTGGDPHPSQRSR